eukprot:358989-Chlamydomonas_euryale.AAC.3
MLLPAPWDSRAGAASHAIALPVGLTWGRCVKLEPGGWAMLPVHSRESGCAGFAEHLLHQCQRTLDKSQRHPKAGVSGGELPASWWYEGSVCMDR